MLNAWKDVYVSKQALCIVSRHRSITIFLFCIKLNDSDVALTAPTSAFWRNIHSLFMLILLFIAILLNLYPNNYVFLLQSIPMFYYLFLQIWEMCYIIYCSCSVFLRNSLVNRIGNIYTAKRE